MPIRGYASWTLAPKSSKKGQFGWCQMVLDVPQHEVKNTYFYVFFVAINFFLKPKFLFV